MQERGSLFSWIGLFFTLPKLVFGIFRLYSPVVEGERIGMKKWHCRGNLQGTCGLQSHFLKVLEE